MEYLQLIILCMTFVVTINRFQKDKIVRAPLGPLMCVELCRYCNQCRGMHFVYIREALLCKITEGNDSKERFIQQDRGPVEEYTRKRCKVSRSKEDKIATPEKKHVGYKKVCGVMTHLVLSMAKSPLCHNVVYFLLVANEKRALISMHLKTWKIKTIFCYKKDDGCRQIFIGPCFGNSSGSCLYKLKVTTVLEIKSYKEQLNGVPKEVGVSLRVKHYRAGQTACFVGKTNSFVCLIRGNLHTIYPGKQKSIVKPWFHQLKFYRSTWIRDIAVDNDFSYVVVVYNKIVSLSSLNYSNMSFVIRKISKVNIQTISREKRLFMFHDGELETPFVLCSISDLLTDSCKSKILIVHQ